MQRIFPVQNTNNRLASGFLSSVSAFPSRNALSVNGRIFTYDALLKRAAGVASHISDKLKGPRIAIYCTHSVDTYASVLAITLLGGSYIPLNPKYPQQRLQEILDLCQPAALLTETRLDVKFDEQIIVDSDLHGSAEVKPLFNSPEAYVLFTSGTTGKPKGVPVTHLNLGGFFDHFNSFDFDENDRFIQPFDLSFDVSVMMMFLCWKAGACLYPVQPEGHKPFNVLSCLRENEITVCAMVPSLLSYIEKYLPAIKMKQVRYTFFAGEKLTFRRAQLWQQACPASTIFNAYGPSEATIVCMAHEFLPDNRTYSSEVPIGRTFQGTTAILVNDDLKEAATGEGEICLSGIQVISHYLHKQDEERFFTISGRRYYRTGDLGYRDKNGDLVFAGRVDGQLKINGYRIEPAEITRAVQAISGRSAEVISINSNGDQVLIGFVESEDVIAGLAEKLLEYIPAYMVPRAFISIKKFPLGAHDKVDKKRLIQLYYERNHS